MKTSTMTLLAIFTIAPLALSWLYLSRHKLLEPKWVEASGSKSETELILRALAIPMEPGKPPRSLYELVRLLRDDFPLEIDDSTLEIAGDHEVNFFFADQVPSRLDMLDAFLASHRLDWSIRQGRIVIADPGDHRLKRIRIYPCPQMDRASIIEAIESLDLNGYGGYARDLDVTICETPTQSLLSIQASVRDHLILQGMLERFYQGAGIGFVMRDWSNTSSMPGFGPCWGIP